MSLRKAKKRTLVWVMTTPKSPGNPQNEKIIAYNAKAKAIMKSHGFLVIDLHSHVMRSISQNGVDAVMAKDGVHFTPQAYRQQAAFLAEQLKQCDGR